MARRGRAGHAVAGRAAETTPSWPAPKVGHQPHVHVCLQQRGSDLLEAGIQHLPGRRRGKRWVAAERGREESHMSHMAKKEPKAENKKLNESLLREAAAAAAPPCLC